VDALIVPALLVRADCRASRTGQSGESAGLVGQSRSQSRESLFPNRTGDLKGVKTGFASRCGSVVLVQESAESVAALDGAGR